MRLVSALAVLGLIWGDPMTSQSPGKLAKPMDLWSGVADPNGIPMNPHWTAQDRSKDPPTLDGCTFETSDRLNCSSQTVSVEELEGSAVACQSRLLKPHVNWGAVTYDGTIEWDSWDWSPRVLPDLLDSDLNFELETPGKNGYTAANDSPSGVGSHRPDRRNQPTDHLPGLGLEMRLEETLAHAGSRWWKAFRHCVESDQMCYQMTNGRPRPGQCNLDNALAWLHGRRFGKSRSRYAVAVGLANLDCVHGCRAELHPVYLLAIRTEEGGHAGVETERWALLARNWGNEGKCASRLHDAGGRLATEMTVRLPWRGGDAVEIDLRRTEAKTNSRSVQQNPPKVTYAKGEGVFVTVRLPAAEEHALLDADLYLCWGPCPRTSVKPGRASFRPDAHSYLLKLQRDQTLSILAGELGTRLEHTAENLSDSEFDNLLQQAVGPVPKDSKRDVSIAQAREAPAPTFGPGPFVPVPDAPSKEKSVFSEEMLKQKLLQLLEREPG